MPWFMLTMRMGGVSRVSTPCTNSVFRGPLRVSRPSLLSRKERLSIVRQSLGLRRAMALGPCSAFLLVFSAVLTNYLSAADDCKGYTDSYNKFHFYQRCRNSYCCGDCYNRYCCSSSFNRFDEDAQDDCNFPHQDLHIPIMVIGIVGSIVFILIFVCCCVCPCCCLYKICRKPQPVIATTHHTIVTSVNGQYPQQPTVPAQSYQGAQPYPPYQPVPVQPGYGTHSMPAAVHQGPQFTPGPLPTYQEAIANPAYPPQPMPYSQAAFQPGQPPYPLQPPVCSNPTAPPAHSDYMAQPAYNPAFAAPPPKTG